MYLFLLCEVVAVDGRIRMASRWHTTHRVAERRGLDRRKWAMTAKAVG